MKTLASIEIQRYPLKGQQRYRLVVTPVNHKDKPSTINVTKKQGRALYYQILADTPKRQGLRK